MTGSMLRLRSAGQAIDVLCHHSPTLVALRALWRPAMLLRERHPTGSSEAARIELSEGGRLTLNGATIQDHHGTPSAAMKIEGLLVQEILEKRKDALHVHAGCVAMKKSNLLFVGSSGAGKSTFSKCSLEQGGTLLTDDSVVIEGTRAYGVARTIQFDPVSDMDESRGYLDDCDIESYKTVINDEQVRFVPLWRHDHDVIDSLGISEKPWSVVVLERGEQDELRPLSSLERLSALHAATVTMGREYAGEFGWGPSFAITWKDPKRAFARLLESIEG